MYRGYISLHRKILESWLWNEKPFSKGQAWVDLLMRAAYTDTEVFIRQSLIELKRGQQARSESCLATNWGWSRNKTRRFLKVLVGKGMIIQQTNSLTSIITICKYDTYQIVKTSGDTTDDTTGKQNDQNDQNEGLCQKQQTAHQDKVVSNCNINDYEFDKSRTAQRTIQLTNSSFSQKINLNDESVQKTAQLPKVTNNFKTIGYKTGDAADDTAEKHRSNIGRYSGRYNILNNINNINNNNNNPQAGVREGMIVSPNLIDEIYKTHPKPIAPNFTKRAVLKALNETLEDGIDPEAEAKRILEATQLYAKITSQWPEADKRYIANSRNWFEGGCYDEDPVSWERDSELHSTVDETATFRSIDGSD
ncbi:MAG: hypothetical protein GY718_06450 [Lentisphaerae bacterium]|nr:hypothetical protein [Lentisphaerota bacterium]